MRMHHLILAEDKSEYQNQKNKTYSLSTAYFMWYSTLHETSLINDPISSQIGAFMHIDMGIIIHSMLELAS